MRTLTEHNDVEVGGEVGGLDDHSDHHDGDGNGNEAHAARDLVGEVGEGVLLMAANDVEG